MSCFVGALAYAELGTMNTSSGAEYAYFMDAFGRIPAFLFSWVSTMVLKPSQLAIICLTFSKYSLEAFIDDREAPEFAIKLFTIVTICKFDFRFRPNANVVVVVLINAFDCISSVFFLFVNCYSVSLATGVQNVFTAAKLIAIAIVCIGGVYKFIEGNPATKNLGFEGTTDNLGLIATGFYSGLWAYDGWYVHLELCIHLCI